MINPRTMCRNHLLGEHVECHMFVGTIKRRKSIRGYLEKGLLEIHNIQDRHDELAEEMQRRGYKHNSPIDFVYKRKAGKINPEQNAVELFNRCTECRKLSSMTLPHV